MGQHPQSTRVTRDRDAAARWRARIPQNRSAHGSGAQRAALLEVSLMETIGEDLRQMIRTPLSPSHVEALRAAGKVVTYPKGTIMVRQGETANRFVYVEEGEIEVVNPFTGERHYP